MPSSSTQPEVLQIKIKIDGTDLAPEKMDQMFEVEVENSLYLPSMFTIRFYDEKVVLINSDTFKAGKAIQILVQNALDEWKPIFKGEITASEPEFTADFVAILVIRGYDKSHRLHRGTKSKVYIQVTDSDIVSQIASANGLTADVEATTEVYKHVFQFGVSDWTFIHERARRNGYEVLVDDQKLYFRKATTTNTTASLAWGISLLEFRPRFSLAKQVNKVTVKGWNPKTKTAIVGVATSSQSAPAVGIGSWGGALAQSAFTAAEVLEVRHPVGTQGEATRMAQAILDEINAGSLQADGTAWGNPTLNPGVKVTISEVGSKFNGDYIVTTAHHIYNPSSGYKTYFTVQGARAQTMADLIDQAMVEQRSTQMWGGVVVGIVTNNNDPENMARVKVKFPWLDDALESNWARVTNIGAGNSHGFLWLPEVNDEVIIAFEHGDFDYPYVIGSVWNGRDAMPETTSAVIADGKVVMRSLKTTAGHIIRLTEKNGDKKIEIIDSTAQTKITLDETNKKIIMESKGDINITSTGNMSLKATGNLNLEATGDVSMKGMNVNVAANANLEAKATGMGKLEATGMLTVKGSLVNIN